MTQNYVRVETLADVAERRPTYLALGSFDGVHRGHQAVLRKMVAAARAASVRSAVLTFFPHPKHVLQDLEGRYYINTLEDRIDLLSGQGVDLVIAHPFNEEVRNIRAADFVGQLRGDLDMRQIWGGNFAFGYQREGDISFLRRLGPEKDFTVQVVDSLVRWEGSLVSSSRIRESLSAADIKDVTGCLGRPFSLSGTVITGDKRGRTIGFPTANLAVWGELLLPANGVYAAYAWLDHKRFMAATNVGVRPTVNGRQRLVEAHLLDFSDDIYGQTIRLEFMNYIRPEKKFSGLEALKAQINDDVVEVKRCL